MNAPSIRRTLLLACGTSTAALLCLLSAGVYLLVRQSLYRELDESVRLTAALLANQVELKDYTISFEWQEGVGTNRSLVENGLFQYWEENTHIATRSAALRASDLPKFSGIGGEPLFRSISLPDGRRARAIGLLIHPFVLPDEIENMKAQGNVIDPKTMPFTLVVARDAEPILHTLDRLRWVLSAGALLTLGLGFIIIQRIVIVSLRPIDELTAQMKDRSEHQLDSALNVPGKMPVELTGLARSFDSLLSRVSAIRQRERDFVRHAAHELRTPIAGLKATTELALSQSRTNLEYRDHLNTCQNAATGLGELVKRLSALARIGQSGAVRTIETFDLAEQFSHCVEIFGGPFEERGIAVFISSPSEKTMVLGDSALSRIILNNLIDNALSYTPAGGTVRVEFGETAAHVEFHISNPTEKSPENPSQWFEPLFRSDPFGDDSGAHLGIGLTLSLEAANAMGWSLIARMTEEQWVELVMRAPKISG